MWVVKTSEGLILHDTAFDYMVQDQIVAGLKKLGLDPADIKYIIISHGHTDHYLGARYLQDTYKAHGRQGRVRDLLGRQDRLHR